MTLPTHNTVIVFEDCWCFRWRKGDEGETNKHVQTTYSRGRCLLLHSCFRRQRGAPELEFDSVAPHILAIHALAPPKTIWLVRWHSKKATSAQRNFSVRLTRRGIRQWVYAQSISIRVLDEPVITDHGLHFHQSVDMTYTTVSFLTPRSKFAFSSTYRQPAPAAKEYKKRGMVHTWKHPLLPLSHYLGSSFHNSSIFIMIFVT